MNVSRAIIIAAIIIAAIIIAAAIIIGTLFVECRKYEDAAYHRGRCDGSDGALREWDRRHPEDRVVGSCVPLPWQERSAPQEERR